MTNHWVIDDAATLRCSHHQLVFLFETAISGCCTHAALEGKCAVGNLPTVVYATNNIVFRTTSIGKEHFTELCGAVGLNNAAYFNTRLLHGHQQIRNAFVLWRIGVGAGEQEAVVGVVALCGPNFLAVNDPFVTVEYGSGFQTCQVAPAVWLTETLAPARLTAKNFWQELLFLFFCSPLQNSWPHQCVAKEVGAHWSLCVGELFRKHNTFHDAQTTAAVFHWPRSADPSTAVQLCWPRLVKGFALVGAHFKACVEPSGGEILFQPSADFSTKFFSCGGVSQFHSPIITDG